MFFATSQTGPLQRPLSSLARDMRLHCVFTPLSNENVLVSMPTPILLAFFSSITSSSFRGTSLVPVSLGQMVFTFTAVYTGHNEGVILLAQISHLFYGYVFIILPF